MIRALLVAAALGLALAAQLLLDNPRPDWILVAPLFAGAALLAAGAFPSDTESNPPEVPSEQELTYRRTIPLLALSLASFAFSLYLFQQEQWPEIATVAWAGALASFAAAFLSWRKPRFRALRPADVGEGALIIGIVLLAFALRFANLENLPPSVHGDEGEFSLSAFGFLEGRFHHPFAVGWFGFPLMSMVPHALTMKLFGVGLFGTRMASVILGTLGVLPFYFMVRLMFGWRVALVGAFLLAVSAPHIHFSRLGLNNIQAPLLITLALYFVFRGFKSRRRLDFVVGGGAVGLSLQAYTGALILPGLVALFGGYLLLSQPSFLRRHGVNMAVMAVAALLTFAPLGLFFLKHSETFYSRSQVVYLFTEGNRAHFKSIYGTEDTADMLRIQFVNNLLPYNWRSDTSLFYGFQGPLLDPWTAPLFVIGMAFSIRRLRDERHLLLLLWFWATLLVGGVLTVDSPSLARLVGLLPVAYAFAAIAVDRALTAFGRVLPKRGEVVLMIPLLLWLGAVGYTNYHNYFDIYPVRDQPRDWVTELALQMRDLSPQYRFYLVTEPILYFAHGTIRFLAPQGQGKSMANVSSALPIRDAGGKGVAFYFAMPRQDQLPEVQRWYPGGSYQLYQVSQGRASFISYLVSSEEVERVALGGGGGLEGASGVSAKDFEPGLSSSSR